MAAWIGTPLHSCADSSVHVACSEAAVDHGYFTLSTWMSWQLYGGIVALRERITSGLRLVALFRDNVRAGAAED